MNIFLIPYTWPRLFMMALWCGGAGLLAWWAVLTWFVVLGPFWGPDWDGPLLMCAISGAIAGASILGEGNLRRRPLMSRIWRLFLVIALAMGFTMIWYWIWHKVSLSIIIPESMIEDAKDSSLVSFRYRLGAFGMSGLVTGLACLAGRKPDGWKGIINHGIGGLTSGLTAAMVWYLFNDVIRTDLYLAGAAMGLSWGFSFGLFTWGIPDELYAGWLRVLSYRRYGHRIPIDATEMVPKERFVGHFPRGLDLFLGIDDGVMEMHISVAVDNKQRYWLRGLSLQPTMLRRFLERVDLRYDPRRPAPLETRLRSGDHLEIGDDTNAAQLEFLMLPREEQ